MQSNDNFSYPELNDEASSTALRRTTPNTTSNSESNVVNEEAVIHQCLRTQKAIRRAQNKRCSAIKQLRKQAACTIHNIEQLVDKLFTALQDIKATLIADVLHKTDRAVRIMQEQVIIEKYSNFRMQKLMQLHIDPAKQQSHYQNLSQMQRQIVSKQKMPALHGKRSVALIAPQLLQLVAALKQQIKTTHHKLRTLTTTSQVILSIGGDASGATREVTAYDPVSQKWTPACSMHTRRLGAAATSWNGKVVVAGGRTEESNRDERVEEYDPVSNSWRPLINLLVGRHSHALVTVNDRIFALGGVTEESESGTNSVETLDKEGTQWTNAKPMIFTRYGLIAVAVRSNIIVAGGLFLNYKTNELENQEKCEKFNIDLNQWSLIASLNISRYGAAAAAHLDLVFVFGGQDKNYTYIDSVEQYDVLTDSWTVLQAKLSVARLGLAAAYLDNCIYLFGGDNDQKRDEAGTATECFNLTQLQFTVLQPLQAHLRGMAAASVVVTAEQMPPIALHRFILCFGGCRKEHYLNSLEAYVPANDKWYTLSQMQTARYYASATSWNNTVVVAGGLPECNMRSVQQYDLLSNTWTNTPLLIQGRCLSALVNLDGTLLAIGGRGDDYGPLSSVEQFDVDTSQWKLTASLIDWRYEFGAAVVHHTLIVAGGWTTGDFKSCEAFDLSTNKWRPIAHLNKLCGRIVAASDGLAVYAFDCVRSVEQYDATADKWTLLTTHLPGERYDFAVACVNSSIYVLGGQSITDFAMKTTNCLMPDRRRFLTKAALPVPCFWQCAVSVDVSEEALFQVLLPLL